MPLELKAVSPQGEIRFVGPTLRNVRMDSIATAEFFLVLDTRELKGLKTPVTLEIRSRGKLLETVKTNFLGPVE